MMQTLAELTARGLSQLDEPLVVELDREAGFPVVRLGRRVTAKDVADAIDED